MYKKRKSHFISILVLFLFTGIFCSYLYVISNKEVEPTEIYTNQIKMISKDWNRMLGPMMTDQIGCIIMDINEDDLPELFFMGGYYVNTEIRLYMIEGHSSIQQDKIELSGREIDGDIFIAKDLDTGVFYLFNRWGNSFRKTTTIQEWKIDKEFVKTKVISSNTYLEGEEHYSYTDENGYILITQKEFLEYEKSICENPRRTYIQLKHDFIGFQNPDQIKLQEYLQTKIR